jgi:hypothetical protein
MSGIYIDEAEAEPAELTTAGIFDDLEHSIHEDIVMGVEAPAAMTAGVSKLLIGMNHENIFVVRRFAKDIAKAIAFEHEVPQRSRRSGTHRRLPRLMSELGWTAVRVRDLTRGGYTGARLYSQDHLKYRRSKI